MIDYKVSIYNFKYWSNSEDEHVILGEGTSNFVSEIVVVFVWERFIGGFDLFSDIFSVEHDLVSVNLEVWVDVLGHGIELGPVRQLVNWLTKWQGLGSECLDSTHHEKHANESFNDLFVMDGLWNDLIDGDVHDLSCLISFINALKEGSEVEGSNFGSLEETLKHLSDSEFLVAVVSGSESLGLFFFHSNLLNHESNSSSEKNKVFLVEIIKSNFCKFQQNFNVESRGKVLVEFSDVGRWVGDLYHIFSKGFDFPSFSWDSFASW